MSWLEGRVVGVAWRWCVAAWIASVCACDQTHRVGGGGGDDDARDASLAMDATARDASPVRDAQADAKAPREEPPFYEEDGGADSRPSDLSCEEQIEEALDGIPDDIRCIGLYSDVEHKITAPRVRRYAPAVPLWSDGSGKQRWVLLPKGEKIDASDPGEWVFPIGTKFFKEFRANGRRVETRLYQKRRSDRWVRATFRWNREETAAKRHYGGELEDVSLYGEDYHMPSGRECDQCHGGRKDRILGFSAISLGLPGAEGVTLADLADEDLLDPPPVRTRLKIGDDGSGFAPQALGWLHINCGVSCHNDNQNAEAYSSGLRLKLDPADLDGRPSVDFEPITTTVDAPTKTKRFGDARRIVPGSPEESILFRLISARTGDKKDQMPPIATKVVDIDHVRVIEAWIRGM